MNLNERIKAFKLLKRSIDEITDINNTKHQIFKQISREAENRNPWFTRQFIRYALMSVSGSLHPENIEKWLSEYPDMQKQNTPKNIGVVMAGNIPLVGFFDMLCVLMSGNKFIGKLSSKDDVLMKFIADMLIDSENRFKDFIVFEEGFLKDPDAIIATGSDNTSRYFEQYFGKYPNIIRKNRNSVAVLDGNESDEQLRSLADDIFLYFGLGCRNVSKLFIPAGYDPECLLKNTDHYKFIKDNNKYANNYDYNRSVFLVNNIKHTNNGFVLLKESEDLSSPIAVIYFEYYKDKAGLEQKISTNRDKIQCIVSETYENSIPFGDSQKPQLWDYADGIDTMRFLIGI